MSAYAGPEISQSGLVFAYDMGNSQKSWKGKPTTNHVPNATAFFGWSNYYRTIERTSFITEFGTTGWRFINQPSWSGLSIGYNVPSTGTYTFSAYYRYLGGTAPNNGGTVYVSGWGGSDSQVSVNKNLVNVWQRVQMTLNLTNLSGAFYLISYGGTDSGTTSPDNTSFEVTMPMIESGSFATPFVDGTRSNTQAILDLIGLNTITVNNLTYYSNNTFSFDGVDDYISSSFATTAGQAVTYLGWLYSTESTATYRNFVDSASTTPMIWWNTSGQIEFDTGGNYTTPTVYRNQWVHVALSKPSGSSAASYYVNGSLVGTGTAYTTPAATATWFNRGGGQTWKGHSSNVQAYNRALSASEIQQNFNALRGRFGI